MGDPRWHDLAVHFETAGIALQQAAEIADQMAGEPTPPEPTPVIITTPAELDAALAAALPGYVLLIDPSLRYLTPLTITVSVTLTNAYITQGRATRSTLMPRFADGVTIAAPDVRLIGIEVQKLDHLTDIVVITGAGCVLDGCRILGDPTLGAKRGIAGNAPNVKVLRCYVDDIKGLTSDPDTQAFAAWDSPGPFLLDDNFFCAASETILFGGGDPSSSANVPADIVITNNTITKRTGMQKVKNLVEFKNARRYRVEGNDLSNCWGPEQGGYAFMVTPRNQDGTAPYSEVKDGIIRNNTVAHVGAVLSMLGNDDLHPSGNLDGLVFELNACTDVDYVTYNGNNKLFLAQRGPLNIAIRGNTVNGIKAGSALYFGEAPNTCQHFEFTNNTVPASDYGIMGASCAPGGLNDAHGSAWSTYVKNGKISGNTQQP